MLNWIHSKTCRIAIASSFLLLSVTAGLWAARQTFLFDTTPGGRSPAPARWPSASRIARVSKAPTLLVFAHPYCSCTKATLDELAGILGHGRAGLTTRVLLFHPDRVESWMPKDLWNQAASLPKTEVSWDDGGREAKVFGAQTSGLVLLYDSTGNLRFQGGITGSRAHVGDNMGARQLAKALDSGRSTRDSFVFGCSLLGRQP